jgi:3-hydroxyisobutyrate dehydrogenase
LISEQLYNSNSRFQEVLYMAIKKVLPPKTKIGWIGTGVMGGSMCRHIIDKGYKTFVYSRTRKKAKKLVESGATWVNSAEAVAENSDVIFTMVGFPQDVRDVYFGSTGVMKGVRVGSVLVDMTTTEPSLSKEIYKEAKLKKATSIDAPVSGGDVGAMAGTLSIMVGGDKDAVEKVMPLFRLMGKNIVYQGAAGSGQHAKICNQVMVSGLMIGMCETLVYGYKAGLDLETMLKSVSRGAAACWMLDNLAPRILKRDFRPGFFVEHFIKDMGIALKEAERMNLTLPGLALAHQLYVAVEAQGHGRKGTQALMLALEKISNVRS